ncbi:MAG: ABC transporter substrate-binding protein [Azospirillaceae bacterium]|nr:ABC transporter substrate-binding protein [Azospirillaceae bacterium]
MKTLLVIAGGRFRSATLGIILGITVVAAGSLPHPAEAAKTALVLGMNIEPAGLDPTVAAPVAVGQVTWQNIFEGLVTIDRGGRVVPQLAESWTIARDGLTYRFNLRQGVRFHDGEPFDAGTARFALDRARGAASVNPQKRFFAAIQSIETPDPATLVLHLSQPAGNLLYWLAWPAASMVGTRSADSDKTAPVGTGPFKFSSWTKGDRVELVRNPDYWNASLKVPLDHVTFRFIGDPQAEVAALRSGDVDAFPEFAAPELMGSFAGDPDLVTVIGNTELKVVAGVNNRRKPFNDKRVRQALMMAIDRPALITGAWSGYGTAIGSHYTPNDRGYLDLTGVLPYDPDKAKALLSEAGYPDGFSFTIKVPQMTYATRTAEVMQAMFAQIGVTMTIEPTEFPAKWVHDVFTEHDFDMTIVAHAEPMDIDIYARDPYYFGYRNPAFDALIRQIDETTDATAQDRIYGEAQKILASDVPALPLFVMPKLGVWQRKLQGLWPDEPIPSNVLADVNWQP